MKNIIEDLTYRNLIKDYSSFDNVKKMFDKPQTIYCGFDPSASSLHIGNFVMISILMRLQKAGHRIIAVVGGATGMIGDPSGRSKERNLLDEKAIKSNVESLKKQLSRFLDFSDPKKGVLLNNYDWLSKMTLIEYLRDYGKYFSINYMLAKDVVASRLEGGISLTEFSYMTLQSIDFLKIYEKYDCRIQIGGSDQWGNLTAGLDLIRRIKGADTEVECITSHLITRSDGKKFGKSEDGALFLDRNLTSPYSLYQFFYNQADEDAVRYLKIFTFLTKEKIDKIDKEHNAALGQRIAQKALAYEVTKIIHGEDAAKEAKKMSEALFSGNYSKLSESSFEELFKNYLIFVKYLGKFLEDILIESKIASSKREAREFINNGAISVNGEKEQNTEKTYKKSDLLFGKYLLIKKGKKNYYLLKN